MSRPQKMHKPLKGGFNQILSAVGLGEGAGKRTAIKLAKEKATETTPEKPAPCDRKGN